LTHHSDKLKNKYQAINKLRAIANKKSHKKQKTTEINPQNQKVKSQIKEIVCQATHKLVDKASTIAFVRFNFTYYT